MNEPVHDKTNKIVLGFYDPVNNEVILSQLVNSGTVSGQALDRLSG